jgi:hypothetical protein
MPEDNTSALPGASVGRHPAAAEVSHLVREARDLSRPVEPGVRGRRNALVRWALLLEEVLP